MPLRNKIVLITGGSRGIGRAIALRLAKDKPQHVIITYCSNHTAARKTEDEIKKMGVDATIFCTEVSREAMLSELFDEVDKRFGRLDIFVNNAARTTFRPVNEISLKAWQRNMDINVRAFFFASQMAARLMMKNGSGRIIAISSLGSRYYVPQYAALGTAKAEIESLARYLAVELAPYNINVNVVCGGFIDTESMRMIPNYEQLKEELAAHTPAQRVGRPEDIAGVVRVLCSPDTDWIRGQTLIADGGYSLI